MFVDLLLCVLATTAASYAHGRDLITKGAIMALHFLMLLIILALDSLSDLSGLISPAVFSVGLSFFMYWFLGRGGKQARAELDYMTRGTAINKAALYRAHMVFSPLLFFIPVIICDKYHFRDRVYPPSAANDECQANKRAKSEIWIALLCGGPSLFIWLIAFNYFLTFIM